MRTLLIRYKNRFLGITPTRDEITYVYDNTTKGCKLRHFCLDASTFLTFSMSYWWYEVSIKNWREILAEIYVFLAEVVGRSVARRRGFGSGEIFDDIAVYMKKKGV